MRKLYLDTSALIYLVEVADSASFGDDQIVTSWITFAEALVKPMQNDDRLLQSAYRSLFEARTLLKVIPVDRDISLRAAELRAEHGLKLPDAIHLATGLHHGCAAFLTGDRGWAKLGIALLHPDDLKPQP